MQIQRTNNQPVFKANLNIKFLSGASDITPKELDFLKKAASEIGTVKDDIFAFVNRSVKPSEGGPRYIQDTVIVSNIDNKLDSANFYRDSILRQRTFDFIQNYLAKLKK